MQVTKGSYLISSSSLSSSSASFTKPLPTSSSSSSSILLLDKLPEDIIVQEIGDYLDPISVCYLSSCNSRLRKLLPRPLLVQIMTTSTNNRDCHNNRVGNNRSRQHQRQRQRQRRICCLDNRFFVSRIIPENNKTNSNNNKKKKNKKNKFKQQQQYMHVNNNDNNNIPPTNSSCLSYKERLYYDEEYLFWCYDYERSNPVCLGRHVRIADRGGDDDDDEEESVMEEVERGELSMNNKNGSLRKQKRQRRRRFTIGLWPSRYKRSSLSSSASRITNSHNYCQTWRIELDRASMKVNNNNQCSNDNNKNNQIIVPWETELFGLSVRDHHTSPYHCSGDDDDDLLPSRQKQKQQQERDDYDGRRWWLYVSSFQYPFWQVVETFHHHHANNANKYEPNMRLKLRPHNHDGYNSYQKHDNNSNNNFSCIKHYHHHHHSRSHNNSSENNHHNNQQIITHSAYSPTSSMVPGGIINSRVAYGSDDNHQSHSRVDGIIQTSHQQNDAFTLSTTSIRVTSTRRVVIGRHSSGCRRLPIHALPEICDKGLYLLYSPIGLSQGTTMYPGANAHVKFYCWMKRGMMYFRAVELPFTLGIPLLQEDGLSSNYKNKENINIPTTTTTTTAITKRTSPSRSITTITTKGPNHNNNNDQRQQQQQLQAIINPLHCLHSKKSSRWGCIKYYFATAADVMEGVPLQMNVFCNSVTDHEEHFVRRLQASRSMILRRKRRQQRRRRKQQTLRRKKRKMQKRQKRQKQQQQQQQQHEQQQQQQQTDTTDTSSSSSDDDDDDDSNSNDHDCDDHDNNNNNDDDDDDDEEEYEFQDDMVWIHVQDSLLDQSIPECRLNKSKLWEFVLC